MSSAIRRPSIIELAHGAIVAQVRASRADISGCAAARDTVPPDAETLSILMPVFNERATLEAAIDDALAAELPVDARQLVIVDDGSTDGTRELLRDARLAAERDASSATTGTAARAPRCTRRSSTRPATTRRSSTPTSSTAPRTSRRCCSRCSTGEARVVFGTRVVVEPFGVQLLVRDRQQGRHARDERALQLLDLGRDDLPQGDAHRAVPLAAPARARASRSSPRSPRECCASGERIYEVPITYKARSRDEGKKLTALDGLRVLRTLVRCRVA